MSHNQKFYDEHRTLSQILLVMTEHSSQLGKLGFLPNQPSHYFYSMRGIIDQIKVIKDRLAVIETVVCIHEMSYKSHGDGEGHFACKKCDYTSCCG